MLSFRFGLSFDDRVWPEFSGVQDLGSDDGALPALGPQKLLNYLEVQCGLQRPALNGHLRTEQYRQALAAYLERESGAFFAVSFAADGLSTASTLLAYRDELVLAGWDFAAAPEMPPRLRDLSNVERLWIENPAMRLEPAFADRWMAVLRVLPERDFAIGTVWLNEPLELLPGHFRRLFEELTLKGAAIREGIEPEPAGESDLTVFQLFLQKKNTPEPRVFRADGSLLLLRAKREVAAAEYLARLFAENPEFRPVCLIPEKNRALDNALIHEGLPSLGIRSASLARPMLQAIKLVQAFLWQPVNPYRLLEFLTLPETPLEAQLAKIIAREISERPGLRGEHWEKSVEEFFRGRLEEAGGDPEKIYGVAQIRADYLFWFDRERVPEGHPAPRSEATELYARLAAWAKRRTEETAGKYPTLSVLHDQASRLVQLLHALPEKQTHLDALELERLVRTVYEATPMVFREEEAQRLPFVHQPGSFAGATTDTLWWNFVRTEPQMGFPRWYAQETDYLRALGAAPEPPTLDSARQLWSRKRPVLQTTGRLLLVVPEYYDGKPAHAHPLMGDLIACFGKALFEKGTVELRPDAPAGRLSAPLRLPENSPLPPRPINSLGPYVFLRRKDTLVPRDSESFTSLSSLLHYPYQWVFKHRLQLYKSSILSVVRDNQLMGNLAHRAFQWLFWEKKSRWTKEEIENWVDGNVGILLEREGAVLLLYGREPERAGFVRTLKRAAWALVNAIQLNGWKVEGTEVPVEGHFAGVPVKGFIDLVLYKDSGERAIVDLKWSGHKRYKDTLQNEQDLQLVLYSRLLGGSSGLWAHSAYFILSDCRLLARNGRAFSEAETLRDDEDHVQANQRIWDKMEATYAWRRSQLEEGKIEIRTDATVNDLETLDAEILLQLLELPKGSAKYDDYSALVKQYG
jgi:ATP-dependent helicase/nuclease subunit B